MEFGSDEKSQGKSGRSSKHGVREDVQPEVGQVAMPENPKEQPDPSAIQEVHNSRNHEDPVHEDTCGEANMEVSVTAGEIVRAGGFGATDDIRCILPVASDSSGFEDHLQKVQGYEDSEDKKAQGLSDDSPVDNVEVGKIDVKDGSVAVNMEASVTSDDVMRAGGFGAKDDISNFLPVASDFTDFEAHLRDARDYEDLKEEITRHGLGWSSERK